QRQGQGRTVRLSQEFCESKIMSSERSQPIGGLSPNWTSLDLNAVWS
ncbi:hypothetical protein LEMLEM_LOCUS24118, partial [Lemmus lemmus]